MVNQEFCHSFFVVQIKYVSARDAGTYECQVSTVPKMSRRVELLVVVPKVRWTISSELISYFE